MFDEPEISRLPMGEIRLDLLILCLRIIVIVFASAGQCLSRRTVMPSEYSRQSDRSHVFHMKVDA